MHQGASRDRCIEHLRVPQVSVVVTCGGRRTSRPSSTPTAKRCPTVDCGPFIKSQLASTQLTLEPEVVKNWSRYPRKEGARPTSRRSSTPTAKRCPTETLCPTLPRKRLLHATRRTTKILGAPPFGGDVTKFATHKALKFIAWRQVDF